MTKKRVLSIFLAFLIILPTGSAFAEDGASPEPTPALESPMPTLSPTPEVSPTPAPGDSPAPSVEASPTPDITPTPEVSPSPEATPSPEVSPTPTPQGAIGRYIVQFTEPVMSMQLYDGSDENNQIGPEDKHLYVMDLDETAYQQLANDSHVASIQPDGIAHALAAPNDPLYGSQWNLSKIDMENAWDIETGDAGVVVAVIDTGATDHPDLTGAIVSPYDVVNLHASFPNYANDGSAPAWHGTFVSGVIAAQSGNSLGVAGMAPGVSIMPINVFEWDAGENDYIAWDSSIITAIYHAIDNGADVINMSLGGTFNNSLVQDAIDDARAQGIVVIAAAGNAGSSVPMYPASYAGVISVSATDQSDQKASFSSYGSEIDLSAPGVSIPGLDLSGYGTSQGTSFSSPMVAALAALLLSHDPTLTPDQVESIMEDYSVDLGAAGWDSFFGEGRIDAYAALSSLDAQLTVTLGADLQSPQAAFTTINLTATVEEAGTYEYYFESRYEDGAWSVLRDWDTNNTSTWTPMVQGAYTLRVSVRPAGGEITGNATLSYTVSAPVWAGMGSASDISYGDTDGDLTQPGEQDIYRFIPDESGAYTIGTTGATDTYGALFDSAEQLLAEDDDSGADGNFSIEMSLTEGVTYYIGVRHTGAGTGAYTLSITRGFGPVGSVILQADPADSSEYRSPVQLSAQITSGDTQGALYQFQIRKTGSSWQTIQEFSEADNCVWTPAAIGTYDIRVFARNSVQEEDATDIITAYVSTDIPKQTGVTLTTDLSAPQEYATAITLIATPEGDISLTERAEYRYIYKYGKKWYVLQDWTDSATCEWTPSKKGTYYLRVYTRTEGRTSKYDTYKTISYSVSDIPKQTSVTLTPDKLPIQEPGTPIILTATATPDDGTLAARAEYMFKYKRGRSSVVIQDWSSDNTCTWVPDAKGTYTLYAYTRTAGRSSYDKYTYYKNYVIDITPLDSVSLTTDVASPQEADTQITLTASATGLHADTAEYLFRVKDGRRWRTLQNWSTTATCTWTPPNEYMSTIQVQARAAGRSGTDVTEEIENYFIYTGNRPVESLDVDITPPAPQEYKTPILIQAQAGGVSADGTEQYMIRVKKGSRWTTLSKWGATKDFTWTPTSTGTYTIEVQSRAAGRGGYDVPYTETYTVIDIPKQEGVTFTTDLASPQEYAVPITLTATPVGDAQLTDRAEYRFRYKLGKRWTTIQDWSGNNTYVWTPSKRGTYYLEVMMRTQGRSGYDKKATIKYTITDIPRQPGVSLTTDKDPVQEPGTEISLTAQTTTQDMNLAARAEYQFKYKQGSTWTVLQDWSTISTYAWTPDTVGAYTLRVYTRTAGRSSYDKYTDKSYEIDTIPLTKVTMVGDHESPVEPETRITFTATAEGVYADNAQYRFTFHNGTRWYTGQGWSTSNTFILQPSHQTTYKVKVEARSPGRTSADVSCTLNYRVTGDEFADYTYSAGEMATFQYVKGGAVKSNGSSWVPASQSDIEYYVNPDNWLDGAYKYQFLSLNYISGITASDLNTIISDNSQNGGVLNGKGAVFLAAAQQYDINPAYLVSHALLETGNGTSALATGITVNGKKVYNMYGIHAYDSDPNGQGSAYAYEKEWFSVDAAITGGAAWIGQYYIHRSSGAQNTLYNMRWNPNAIQNQINAGQTPSPTHQYATDIAWAVKQVNKLKSLMDRCVGAVLEFIIPNYRN